MKKVKKMVGIFMSLLMVFSMVSCGGQTSSKGGGKQANGTDSSSNGNQRIYEGIEIVYWSNWEATETQAQIIIGAVAEFEEETGAIVDLQFKGRNGMKSRFIPALELGQEVDMFDGAGNKSGFLNYLADVEELVASTGYEQTGNKAMMALCRSYYSDGKLREIPYQMKGNGFLYNKALFRQAGIEKVPTTWKEFEQVCEKLSAAGITPMTTDDAYAPQAFGIHLARMLGTDNVQNVVKEGLWAESPEVLATAQVFEKLAAKGYFSEQVAGNKFPAGQNTEFATGEVAMYVCGTWLPNEVYSITGDSFEWGFFNYPEVEGGINGTEAMVVGCQSFAITNQCKNPEVAFALIEKLTRGEWDAKLAEATIGLPMDNENTEWPVQLMEAKTYFDSCTEIFAVSGGLESNSNINPALKGNLAKLYGGEITAEEFVNNMEKASEH